MYQIGPDAWLLGTNEGLWHFAGGECAQVAPSLKNTALSAVAAAEGIVLSAETTGKYKMTAQVLAILFLIMAESVDPTWNFSTIGNVLLYSALMLGLISGTQYLVTFWREISLKGL